MTALHLLPLACLALGALLVLRPVPALRQARRTATAVSVAALLVFICVETLAGGGSPLPTFARPYVALILLVNLVAVGMTPLTRGLERWLFARMLVVSGSSGAMVLLSEAWVVAGLWCLQSVVVFGDVRRRVGLGRVFLAYQALSCLALLVALVLGDVVGWRAGVLPLLIAVAIREAIVPFHSWLPRLFERAPMGLVVVYAAPQLGVWLHLAWLNGHLDPALMARVAQFGAFTALVAALLGVFQNNPRRAVAYLFMSQSGLLTFGIESHSSIAQTGTLLVWMGVGLATTGLAMLLAVLEARRGPLRLSTPSGSLQATPRLGAAFLVLGLASVGLPGSLGFVSEDLVFQGAVHEFPAASLVLVFVTGINGITVMRCFMALFGGSTPPVGLHDLTRRETLLASALLVCLIGAGWFPEPLLKLLVSAP